MAYDPITALNLAFCIIIVGVGYWGFMTSRRISKVLHTLPLWIGAAFGLFGISHFITLLGQLKGSPLFLFQNEALIVIRSLAYIIVIVALILVIRTSVKLYKQAQLRKPSG